MSLFSSLQVSANALRVNQLGLQVVSNNIANANTPGYIRQELIQATGPGYRVGDSILGQGVRAVGVQQRVDEYLLQSLRDVQSQIAVSESIDEANDRVEAVLDELGENDLSSAMSRFSNAMQDVANQPGNAAIRSLAIQRGRELAEGLRSLAGRVSNVAERSDLEIRNVASDINRLTARISKINQRIVELEGGSSRSSDAVGLRDDRIRALDELSTLINVQAIEQESGAVTVLVGGDYLVADGIDRPVEIVLTEDQKGGSRFEVRIVDTEARLQVTGGRLKGLYEVRDGTIGGLSDRLDDFARGVIRKINRIHSSGQGLNGLLEVTGDPLITDPSRPIEEAGSQIDIENGTFIIHVHDATTNQTRSFDILVSQQGDDDDTTINDLISQINQIVGLQATISADGRFQIRTASSAIRFSFSHDTSGVLSNLGLNTFFTGNSATNIQVREDLIADPSRLAISLDGPGRGNRNAIALAEAFEQVEESLGGRSLRESYESILASTTQDINSQKSITDGLRNFYQSLQAKHLGITGVSLDEEGIRMLTYQRAFQASSRLIATTNDLLETLVNII